MASSHSPSASAFRGLLEERELQRLLGGELGGLGVLRQPHQGRVEQLRRPGGARRAPSTRRAAPRSPSGSFDWAGAFFFGRGMDSATRLRIRRIRPHPEVPERGGDRCRHPQQPEQHPDPSPALRLGHGAELAARTRPAAWGCAGRPPPCPGRWGWARRQGRDPARGGGGAPSERRGGARPAGATDAAGEVVGVDQLAAAGRAGLERGSRGGRHRGGGAGRPRRRAPGHGTGRRGERERSGAGGGRRWFPAVPELPARAERPRRGGRAAGWSGGRGAGGGPARAAAGAAEAACASRGSDTSFSGHASACAALGSGGCPSTPGWARLDLVPAEGCRAGGLERSAAPGPWFTGGMLGRRRAGCRRTPCGSGPPRNRAGCRSPTPALRTAPPRARARLLGLTVRVVSATRPIWLFPPGGVVSGTPAAERSSLRVLAPRAARARRPGHGLVRERVLGAALFTAEAHRPGPASVPEVAHPGEDHRHVVLVGGGDDLGVAHAAPRLDHAPAPRPRPARPGRPGRGRRRRRPPRCPGAPRLRAAAAIFTDSTRLVCPPPDGQEPVGGGEDDGVALHVLAHPPAEAQRRQLGVGGGAPGHHLPFSGGLDRVAVLDQQPAGDAPQLERGERPGPGGPAPCRASSSRRFFFAGEHRPRALGVARGR